MECAGRALSFWAYQTTQDIYYQQYLYKTLTDKYSNLSVRLEKTVNDANTEIEALHHKLSNQATEQDALRRKNEELSQAYKEKSRKVLQLQELYDKVKRKAELGQIQRAASDAVDSTLQTTQHDQSYCGRGSIQSHSESHPPPAFGQGYRPDISEMNTGLPRSYPNVTREDSHWPRLGGVSRVDTTGTSVSDLRRPGIGTAGQSGNWSRELPEIVILPPSPQTPQPLYSKTEPPAWNTQASSQQHGSTSQPVSRHEALRSHPVRPRAQHHRNWQGVDGGMSPAETVRVSSPPDRQQLRRKAPARDSIWPVPTTIPVFHQPKAEKWSSGDAPRLDDSVAASASIVPSSCSCQAQQERWVEQLNKENKELKEDIFSLKQEVGSLVTDKLRLQEEIGNLHWIMAGFYNSQARYWEPHSHVYDVHISAKHAFVGIQTIMLWMHERIVGYENLDDGLRDEYQDAHPYKFKGS
ncbi:hypothetical protein F66182_9147 [Fusarium sp. NRRL 66182]|nr:hypothetical protein F66182_9147 [Fusarium sp. NRRL 66182]